ncbi:MAG: hypothetical protein Q7U84_05905, partial [Polynucleobacter sp.]|nr:hypothetical protein [Polynucleobacter sp.]
MEEKINDDFLRVLYRAEMLTNFYFTSFWGSRVFDSARTFLNNQSVSGRVRDLRYGIYLLQRSLTLSLQKHVVRRYAQCYMPPQSKSKKKSVIAAPNPWKSRVGVTPTVYVDMRAAALAAAGSADGGEGRARIRRGIPRTPWKRDDIVAGNDNVKASGVRNFVVEETKDAKGKFSNLSEFALAVTGPDRMATGYWTPKHNTGTDNRPDVGLTDRRAVSVDGKQSSKSSAALQGQLVACMENIRHQVNWLSSVEMQRQSQQFRMPPQAPSFSVSPVN